MNEFEIFNEISDELDDLTLDGFFGESARSLVIKREDTEQAQYLYECLINIFEPNMYGTKNVIGIMLRLAEMYSEACKKDAQQTVDILTAFMRGTEQYPELECFSSYGEYVRYHVETKNYLKKIQGAHVTDAQRKNLASLYLTDYSKGVELVGKMFTFLLAVQQLINNEPYDLLYNSTLTIYNKTQEFLRLSEGRYDILVTVIDRDIRNADSHLNGRYSIKKEAYLMKNITKIKGKPQINEFTIPVKKMILEISPKIGWFVQGFLGAGILLVLAHADKEKYKQASRFILSLNK